MSRTSALPERVARRASRACAAAVAGAGAEPHDPILQRDFWRAPVSGSPLRLVHSET